MNKIKEKEKTVDRENLIYRASEYTYSAKNFQTIGTFGKDIHIDEINLKEADDDQSKLLVEIMNFKKKNTITKLRSRETKKEKMFLKTCMHLLRVEKEFLTLLKVKYCQ